MKTIKIPSFQSNRIVLRKILPKDQLNIFRGLSNSEVGKYYGVSYNSFEDTKEQMNWYSNLEKSGSRMWWVIESCHSKEFYGAIGFNDYHKEYKRAEIGFWLLPDHWGKGIIKEAAEIVTDYLLNHLKIHRLEAYVETENTNSSKVLKN